jgi:hypothetical protein
VPIKENYKAPILRGQAMLPALALLAHRLTLAEGNFYNRRLTLDRNVAQWAVQQTTLQLPS